MTRIQPFSDLEPAIERALADSIRRHGILVPLVFDQHGRLLDGHHRKRIADEFGVTYDRSVRFVESDEEAHQLAVELNLARRHLNPAERRRVAADLRRRGHSLRAIAAVTGVSKSQTAHDVQQVSTTGHVIGLDAKRYPARRPQIYVRSDVEQRRAQDALTTLGSTAPNRTLRLVDAEHRMRKQQIALRRGGRGKAKIGTAELHVADFRDLLGSLRAGSVDLLLTDVPYSRKHYKQFIDSGLDDLAEEAARVLKRNGSLAVMVGTSSMPRACEAFGANLRYRHTIVCATSGVKPRLFRAHTHVGWKPILIYYRTDGTISDGHWITEDVIVSPERTKVHHEHEQHVDVFVKVIEQLTSRNALIVDPMCGSGTSGVAAVRLGRRFIGGDIDAHAVEVARRRLADEVV